MPTLDVYEDLWQLTHVTASLTALVIGAIDVGTLKLSAAAVFALMRVQGSGVRAYARKSADRQNNRHEN